VSGIGIIVRRSPHDFVKRWWCPITNVFRWKRIPTVLALLLLIFICWLQAPGKAITSDVLTRSQSPIVFDSLVKLSPIRMLLE
jgi:hypothetical protein